MQLDTALCCWPLLSSQLGALTPFPALALPLAPRSFGRWGKRCCWLTQGCKSWQEEGKGREQGMMLSEWLRLLWTYSHCCFHPNFPSVPSYIFGITSSCYLLGCFWREINMFFLDCFWWCRYSVLVSLKKAWPLFTRSSSRLQKRKNKLLGKQLHEPLVKDHCNTYVLMKAAFILAFHQFWAFYFSTATVFQQGFVCDIVVAFAQPV